MSILPGESTTELQKNNEAVLKGWPHLFAVFVSSPKLRIAL